MRENFNEDVDAALLRAAHSASEARSAALNASIGADTPLIINTRTGALSVDPVKGLMITGGLTIGPFSADAMLSYQQTAAGLNLDAKAPGRLSSRCLLFLLRKSYVYSIFNNFGAKCRNC